MTQFMPDTTHPCLAARPRRFPLPRRMLDPSTLPGTRSPVAPRGLSCRYLRVGHAITTSNLGQLRQSSIGLTQASMSAPWHEIEWMPGLRKKVAVPEFIRSRRSASRSNFYPNLTLPSRNRTCRTDTQSSARALEHLPGCHDDHHHARSANFRVSLAKPSVREVFPGHR